MTFRQIIYIAGKPGLFYLKNAVKIPYTVEEITTGHKVPIFAKDKVSSLADMAVYTEEGDTPLGEVFTKIYDLYKEVIPEEKDLTSSHESLRGFIEKVLPTYNVERVHDSDIRKLIKWYIALRKAGIDRFLDPEETSEDGSAEQAK